MPRLPWRNLFGWTALGLALGLGLLLFNYRLSADTLGPLVATAPGDVSAPILGSELGPTALNAGGQHDGHYFYLMARAPMHLDSSAPYVDFTGYRLGRPVMAWAAWALHPTGGGWGLVWALFAVGVGSLVLGGLGLGALTVTFGGRPWTAALFPVFLGSVLSLRISVPDPLAIALAIWAVVLLYRRHLLGAVVVGALAVLTKETMLLVFAGILLARRDRPGLLLVVVPGAAYAAWRLWLRLQLGQFSGTADGLTLPGAGLVDSVRWWLAGNEPLGFVALGLAVILGIVALAKRGVRHPLSYVVILQLAFILFLNIQVLGPERNASRAVLPLMAAAVVMLATPAAARIVADRSRPAAPLVPTT